MLHHFKKNIQYKIGTEKGDITKKANSGRPILTNKTDSWIMHAAKGI
jgi:hypothetical protein